MILFSDLLPLGLRIQEFVILKEAIPILGLDCLSSIGELVMDRQNGLLFSSSSELADQLMVLLNLLSSSIVFSSFGMSSFMKYVLLTIYKNDPLYYCSSKAIEV